MSESPSTSEMNTEYAKFNEPRDEYNPPATEPGYFSNIPDVLVPSEYEETGVNPLELEDDELMRRAATPPPTPPELTPGKAGCNVFREGKVNYMDPAFQDPAYVRKFMAKIVFFECSLFIPSFIILMVFCAWKPLDLLLLKAAGWFYGLFAGGLVGTAIFIYFVGLCRNRPFVQIGYVMRMFLSTIVFTCGTLTIHILFLKMHFEEDPVAEHTHVESQHALDEGGGTNHTDTVEHLLFEVDWDPPFSRPYMGVFMILLFWINLGTLALVFLKFGWDASDYRVPILMYFICFMISPCLVTVALNNGFDSDPVGYDLFQILLGCLLVNFMSSSTPDRLMKLMAGKICPLFEDELLYAALHYGL